MKKLIAMLLAMVMVLGLVACAAKTEPPRGRHQDRDARCGDARSRNTR